MRKKGTVNIKKRMVFVYGLLLSAMVVLLLRTAYWQFIKGPSLKQEAIEQQTRDSIVSSERGTIYDRNMKVLAQSASTNMVCVVPVTIKEEGNAEEVARALSDILELDYDTVYKKTQKNSYYEIVKRRVEAEEVEKIRALGLPGIRLDDDTKRYYPNGSLASHVIGFTGDDNQGLWGLESVYDKVLAGRAGRIITAKSANGSDMPYAYEQYMDPVAGNDLLLTIDETIQHFVEKHLETAVAETNVQNGAAAIVMNPKTGEILAMATKPDYDLNQPMTLDAGIMESLSALSGEEYQTAYSKELNKLWRNKAVVDTYEPGSTFKSVVAATALEENVVGRNEGFYCSGSHTVSGVKINCHKTIGHGAQSFEEGVHNSCNPVFMEIGARIGWDTFYKYYKNFGFGETTGFDLPGEAEGIFFTPENRHALELATSSFGQGFNVTMIQEIAAFCSLINGGNYYEPHLVDKITDSNGAVVENIEPRVLKQVVSESTSEKIRQYCRAVVMPEGGNARTGKTIRYSILFLIKSSFTA